ncbi:ionotropic receptor 40a-like [Vespula squamosa]|uniref:Ionotropic receptor 40a-like n=1 Tax=Vespula squamosa TaxID=30214 RepID=A0ABD2ALZ6_VESSQ
MILFRTIFITLFCIHFTLGFKKRYLQIDHCKKSARHLRPVIDQLIEEITNRSTCTVFVTDRIYHGLINNNKKLFNILKYNILLRDNEEFSPPRQRIQKILEHSKTARCNGYVILIANGLLVSEFLKYVERKELVNTHGFFLLLHDYRILTSDLNYIWNRIINVVFVHQYKPYKYRSGETSTQPIINLETVYFPNRKQKFVITKYLDTWYNGKFRYGKNHFVQKISDLKGKTLRVSVFEHIPAVTKESQNFYKGGPSYSAKGLGVEFEVCIRILFSSKYYLIRVISQFMNFKAHYYMPYNIDNDRWGALEKNGTYTGLIGEAVARRAAFYIGDLHYTSYLLQFFELSIPYNTECLTFLTSESLTDNSWKLLILPFKLYTWIAVLFTLLLAGGIFHLFSLSYQKHIIICKDVKQKLVNINEPDKIKDLRIKKAKKGIYLFTEAQNSMLYTYSMLLLVSLPRLPNPWALRVLIGWWWIYSILVVVIYRASMTASLANPVATITIDTLDQLARSSISVGGWSNESKEFFLQSSDFDSQEIGNKFQLIKNEKESIEKVANGSFGYYENEFSLRFAHITKYALEKKQEENNTQNNKTSGVKHNLHIMKDCIINMPIALGMDKNSPLKPYIDLWVRRMIEVGLVNKWLSDVIYPSQLIEKQQEKMSEKALVNLHKLYGALVALSIGYFVSLIILLSEILHWKYIILNNPEYDKYHLDKFYAKI